MKTSPSKPGKSGVVSYVLVLSTAAILTLLTISAYCRPMAAREVQGKVQLRVDYHEKEDAILRSIMSITPNRAIRAMKSGSNANSSARDPLAWQAIFHDALVLANASKSISPQLQASLGLTAAGSGNTGDLALTDVTKIFNRASIYQTGVTAWKSTPSASTSAARSARWPVTRTPPRSGRSIRKTAAAARSPRTASP